MVPFGGQSHLHNSVVSADRAVVISSIHIKVNNEGVCDLIRMADGCLFEI
jgi:hypothetical protein